MLQYLVSHIEPILLDHPNTIVGGAVGLGKILTKNIESRMFLSPVKVAGINGFAHKMQPKFPGKLCGFRNSFRSQIVAFSFTVKFQLAGKLILDMNLGDHLPRQAYRRQHTKDNQ